MDQAVQAVAAVLASDQEGTALRQRQQAGWPGSGAQDALGRVWRDGVEDRQHLEPTLLGRAEAAQDFALDVTAQQ